MTDADPDDTMARLAELQRRSRAAAEAFRAEMSRLTREVTQRPPDVRVDVDASGRIVNLEVEPGLLTGGGGGAAAATSAALAAAGVVAVPVLDDQVRLVRVKLTEGTAAAEALRVAAEQTSTARVDYAFPDVSVTIDAHGFVRLSPTAEWLSGTTSTEFAAAVRKNVNEVLARRAWADERTTNG